MLSKQQLQKKILSLELLDGECFSKISTLRLFIEREAVSHTNLQWYVPKQSRLELLRIFHDEQCHIGSDKTYESIVKHFWFLRMRQFFKCYVKHCLICAVQKTRTGPLQGFINNAVEKPEEPFHTLHMDSMGPLPTSTDGFKQHISNSGFFH